MVKAGHGNDTHPVDADWLFHKAAAVARQIYISKSQDIGLGSLKAIFGRKKRGGVRPPKYVKAGGKVLREVVKQLKLNGYVDNYATQEGSTFGLVLTKTGRSELDKIANRLVKERKQ